MSAHKYLRDTNRAEPRSVRVRAVWTQQEITVCDLQFLGHGEENKRSPHTNCSAPSRWTRALTVKFSRKTHSCVPAAAQPSFSTRQTEKRALVSISIPHSYSGHLRVSKCCCDSGWTTTDGNGFTYFPADTWIGRSVALSRLWLKIWRDHEQPVSISLA